jgi:uncharacterized membrane protein YbhN (UPF0104 family)
MKKVTLNYKKISTYIVYLSLIFLFIYLYKKDIFVIPHNLDHRYVLFSIILLFLGEIFHGMQFWIILKRYGYFISVIDSIRAYGLNIFSRYVPGKVWVFVGPVTYIKGKYGYPLDSLLTVSLSSQFIGLWIVLTLSMVVLFLSKLSFIIKLLCIIAWIALTLIVFTRYFHNLVQWLFLKVAKKTINIPQISIKKYISIFPVYILSWICSTVGFYLLCLSFGIVPNLITLFAYPLATIIGMLVVFIPGGLGVREGILVMLLIQSGIPAQLATTISVTSRLWALLGEAFIFLSGLILKIYNRDSLPMAKSINK